MGGGPYKLNCIPVQIATHLQLKLSAKLPEGHWAMQVLVTFSANKGRLGETCLGQGK